MRSVFLHGVRDGIPIALSYYVVAFSLGIIAGSAGMEALLGFVSSFFTRASAGEYSVYTLMAASATYAEVVGMSIVANLRYFLMGTVLSQKFDACTSYIKRIFVSLCITDEVFGISIAYPGYLTPAYTFGAALVSTIFWAAGTASGIIAGDVLPANIVSALSVALYGIFISIVIPPSRADKAVAVAVVGSFVLSGLCAVMPLVRELSGGTRIIILTMLISAVAAIVKPVGDEEAQEGV